MQYLYTFVETHEFVQVSFSFACANANQMHTVQTIISIERNQLQLFYYIKVEIILNFLQLRRRVKRVRS